jgi:hypothetical protein
MADKAAIRARAISRLTEKKLRAAAWGDIVAAFTAASAADRAAFAAAYAEADKGKVLRRMEQVMRPWATGEATTEVDAALVDDLLTLDEFEALFT